MEDSFEIKPPQNSIHFGMTPDEIKQVVKKMKQDNDLKMKH
jgi:hypothetical protein